MKKKIDNRIRTLIENNVKKNHRSFFVIVGDRGKDQVVNLHYILSHAAIRPRPTVLWCYKKELALSSHKKKRMKQIKRMALKGLVDKESDNPFELFMSSTQIRWCYYAETHQILGQTFGMCVLQDFESITPNLLARTIETVEGGGIVVLLLQTMTSLRQLYTMTMEAHQRFKTHSHNDLVPRFNERFILSLAACKSCLVVDDELNILPLSNHMLTLRPIGERKKMREREFEAMMLGRKPQSNSKANAGEREGKISEGEEGEEEETEESIAEKEKMEKEAVMREAEELTSEWSGAKAVAAVLGRLLPLAKTADQCSVLNQMLRSLAFSPVGAGAAVQSSETAASPPITVSVTAPRGRGKSAALGLAIAGGVCLGYSSVVVSAPSPENVSTVFEFVMKGLAALDYAEHTDFEARRSTLASQMKCVVEIHVTKTHRQRIFYVGPGALNTVAAGQDLVVIDEAAAIPLPLLKSVLLGSADSKRGRSLSERAAGGTGRDSVGDRGSGVVIVSSTISGYEGTGRSLSLKLMRELRRISVPNPQLAAALSRPSLRESGKKAGKEEDAKHKPSQQQQSQQVTQARSLVELELSAPIRYSMGDDVESWLNSLLCLSAAYPGASAGGASSLAVPSASLAFPPSHLAILSDPPSPAECSLYQLNRDTLFSFHRGSELFLQQLVSLFVSSHYRNSPNDLLLMADAPAHPLFVLLPPISKTANTIPFIITAVQIAYEGSISRDIVLSSLARGQRASGDMIPWTISNQYQDPAFAELSGARIIRIATQPQLQGMGYGLRTVELLRKWMEQNVASDESASITANRDIEATASIVQQTEQDDSSSDDDEDDEDDDEGEKLGQKKRMKKADGTSVDASSSSSSGSSDASTQLYTEQLLPRPTLPPLLLPLFGSSSSSSSETVAHPPRLQWLGTAHGLTLPLLSFWLKTGMIPLHIRQTPNEQTGEHSCVMLMSLRHRVSHKRKGNKKTKGKKKSRKSSKSSSSADHSMNDSSDEQSDEEDEEDEDEDEDNIQSNWLEAYSADFTSRLCTLLSFSFSSFSTALALSLVDPKKQLVGLLQRRSDANKEKANRNDEKVQAAWESAFAASFPRLSAKTLPLHLSDYDMKRLESYGKDLVDFHLVMDVIPTLAALFFTRRFRCEATLIQQSLLVAIGLQRKGIDELAEELTLPVETLLVQLQKLIRKVYSALHELK
ncbi:putative N-acetyltransferase 10 [Monocercomonoides exilis]|uniref:putative N-acetyltransferase 10 n=1 Tax=Monocercomonoides exilis TaxID=2049356 RepID=UPI00355A424A|nr:putative N-acetyltransferase 10 [Monocercomonoides exilis]|eukprot:MONOS_12166.1-p1 / transcript=MONOS_12166.1 / gene=MONOS_12166 / organism=Monocercomonoides_exilis_PA203 / gene_product=N-acetyltransferase 10 / transcript_product=N-acetyltransferase 10 / location=Mono_scaffold00655:12782-16763(+) / protein_length=1193 / sequence_SO=supercontig / SO=protein_coding / is_pseudo=false